MGQCVAKKPSTDSNQSFSTLPPNDVYMGQCIGKPENKKSVFVPPTREQWIKLTTKKMVDFFFRIQIFLEVFLKS